MNFKSSSILWMSVFLFFLLEGNTLLAQQDEKLELKFEELNWKDINDLQSLTPSTKVISGSRSEKEVKDLPFTIYVITGEEIRSNGYITLTDVLKRLPGIRVSQPGSALEGETFLMRGLLGNAYTKILINDIPIKPFIVSGMPIGAQLPIREAERIEVIYGPAATLYGADASAGVINIILKETDRPVYIQADLGFGVDGFENLDIMFGGKLGKGKKILTFKAFGAYTAFDDRQIKYDRLNVYNPQIYQNLIGAQQTDYVNRPNYRGGPTSPVLGDLPHLSNTLGIDLKYRKWQLSVFRFVRRDHSSLGLSPLAVSYGNPLNSFGERINSGTIRFNTQNNRLQFKSSVGILNYATDNRSSYSYVLPALNFVLQGTPDGTPVSDSINQFIDDQYFSNERYSRASSFELNAEGLLSYTFNNNVELAGGVTLNAGDGTPLRNFILSSVNSFVDTTVNNVVNINNTTFVDLSAFVECYFNYNKWNAIIGAQIFSRQTDYLSRQQPAFNPRIALQYHWSEKFSLRSSIGRSFRYPSPFFQATSYTVRPDDISRIIAGADLSTEETLSADFGCRWKIGDKIEGDASLYFTRTSDFVSHAVRPNGNVQTGAVTIGYFNDRNSRAELLGIQNSISISNLIEAIGLSTRINLNYNRGRETLDLFLFAQDEERRLQSDGIRSLPRWIGQVDIELKPIEKFRFLLENTFMSSSLPRNTILYQIQNTGLDTELRNPGFYTLDLVGNYQISKQLAAFIRINNVFGKKYAGIDATDDADVLLYNPQSTRISRIGISYRLD